MEVGVGWDGRAFQEFKKGKLTVQEFGGKGVYTDQANIPIQKKIIF